MVSTGYELLLLCIKIIKNYPWDQYDLLTFLYMNFDISTQTESKRAIGHKKDIYIDSYVDSLYHCRLRCKLLGEFEPDSHSPFHIVWRT